MPHSNSKKRSFFPISQDRYSSVFRQQKKPSEIQMAFSNQYYPISLAKSSIELEWNSLFNALFSL